MRSIRKIFILFFLIILLVSCSSKFADGTLVYQGSHGFVPLPKLENEDEQGQYSPAVTAYNETDYEDLWNLYDIDKNRPRIDFEKYAVLFIDTTENTCPKSITHFELRDNSKELFIETTIKGTNCNDVGYPKLFVFQVEEEKLKNVKNILFEGQSIKLNAHNENPNRGQ